MGRGLPQVVFFLLFMASGCASFFPYSHLVLVPANEVEKTLELAPSKDAESFQEAAHKGKKETEAKEQYNPGGETKTLNVRDLPPVLQLMEARAEERKTEEEKGQPCVTPFILPPPLSTPDEKVETKVKLSEAQNPDPSKAEATPEGINSPLAKEVQAYREFLKGQNEQGEKLLREIASPYKDSLQFLLPFAARLSQAGPLSKKEAANYLEGLKKVQKTLRGNTDLGLANLHFCKQVHGYGAFDPVPKGHEFHQGQGSSPGEKVLLYVEVENVEAKKMPHGYETILSSSLEIHDSKGKIIGMAFPAKIDVSKTPRNDFHLTFHYRVPPKLPTGLYTLWITVEESPAPDAIERKPRICKRSLDFRVGLPSLTRD